MIKMICENEKTIMKLAMSDGENIIVGKLGVSKIEPYLENGQMAHVTWFAIWSKECEIGRVNAAHVSRIYYKVSDENKEDNLSL